MSSSEAEVNGGGAARTAKVFLRALPPDTNWDDLKSLVSSIAPLSNLEQSGNPEHPTAIATMATPDDATLLIARLNNYAFQDTNIKGAAEGRRWVQASAYMEKGQRGGGRRPGGGRGAGGDGGYRGGMIGGPGGGGLGGANTDMPLRMVVDARYVGAIIGQGGANIREITRDSKARCVVDVNRGIRDQSGQMEKVINVYGQPENCSKAAMRILGVVMKEAAKEAESGSPAPQPELKLRAHNQLVGRLIGKGGATIKKIMEDTGTTIFVSNDTSVMGGGGGRGGGATYDMGIFSLERTITIRGQLSAIEDAEKRISAKLRQCWENDMMNAPHMGFGGPHPLFPPGFPGDPLQGFAMHPMASAYGSPGPFPPGRPALVESVHLYVPNAIVGALIGTKGVHIRNVMRITGATIRIEGGTVAKGSSESGDAKSDDRLVIINGNDVQQCKAQYWIYQRVSEQSGTFLDDVRLVTEVAVPTKLVGRIIGKAGQNVRDMQRMTGALVKIPETNDADADGETIVRITANFQASQDEGMHLKAVQARIRQMVIQHNFGGGAPGHNGAAPHRDRD